MTELAITAETTVNEAVRRHPGALRVLASFGIDTCCGGALPIEEAAKRHGVDAALLVDLIRSESG